LKQSFSASSRDSSNETIRSSFLSQKSETSPKRAEVTPKEKSPERAGSQSPDLGAIKEKYDPKFIKKQTHLETVEEELNDSVSRTPKPPSRLSTSVNRSAKLKNRGSSLLKSQNGLSKFTAETKQARSPLQLTNQIGRAMKKNIDFQRNQLLLRKK